MTTTGAASTARFEALEPADPRLEPVLEDLVHEYHVRYGEFAGHDPRNEVYEGLETAYTAQNGGVFLALLDGETVIATGAARRFDEETVEFKKIWSHPERRGRRLSTRLLARLEDEARLLGYRKVFLTTGPRQPEADRLYERNGYTAHYDPEEFTLHAYTKALVADADGTTLPPDVEELFMDFGELILAESIARAEAAAQDEAAAQNEATTRDEIAARAEASARD
ncbi:GNAT family N-acetyltransferase [Gulosibacter sp. 10]|uniref:GNAT family N-acetyltransferase n=1 Tax=Gulosibacter sp. 10 TaxID=1255570 RepID=UPI00097EB95A|nr:GNAT family N-acetyltransferase [Gulosibacter sp. 10]SJM57474.1 Histone acetyltransferase HPA2 and related acetyltransferases [Gulosibacter sp. 10]